MGNEERRIGSIIGKWRVDSVLGSGSMAAVYAVTHRNGSRAALKVLHPQLCQDEALIERFLSEGYLANIVAHPGILRVFDDGMTEEGCPFLAMEMLRGETLEDYRLRNGEKLDLDTTMRITDAVLDVLAAVHAGGVIHRDLKPSNVFLTAGGETKLLDFGVAKLSSRRVASKASLGGVVLGTPAYMAPEQALGKRTEVDVRSDIFAVGAMIFTMLSGEHVHPVVGAQKKLLAAATTKARPVGSVVRDLPETIAAIIDKALEFKAEDRWPTVNDLRAALREAHRESSANVGPDSDLLILARPVYPGSMPPHGLDAAAVHRAPSYSSFPTPVPPQRPRAQSYSSYATFTSPPPIAPRPSSPSYPAFTGFSSAPQAIPPPAFTGFASVGPPPMKPPSAPSLYADAGRLSPDPAAPRGSSPWVERAPSRTPPELRLPAVTTSRIVSLSGPPPAPEPSSSAPPAAQQDFSIPPPAPAVSDGRPALGASDAIRALWSASTKQEIGDLIVDYLRSAFECGVVLVLRDAAAVGWKGFAPDARPHNIASLELPLGVPSVFRVVYEGRAIFKGAPPSEGGALQGRFWRLLACPPPKEVIVAPITLGKRVVNLVYAHGFGGGVLASGAGSELASVCDAARDGYARIIAKASASRPS